jgi:uncharacterized protein (UPF0371 family)
MKLFPVVKRILEKITGAKSVYQSPTDVNKSNKGIVDNAAVQAADPNAKGSARLVKHPIL